MNFVHGDGVGVVRYAVLWLVATALNTVTAFALAAAVTLGIKVVW